jgi:CheY-like chemotaxis protein
MSDTEQRPLVLVAEDDDSNFKLIHAIIGKQCDILWGRNGREIVKLFEENRDRAKAILMDIKMPEVTGIEATATIRTMDKNIPIIMQTAYAFNADREAALKAGASAVLIKPLVLVEVRKCLASYIPGLEW